MVVLGWIATTISIIGIALNAKKIMLCWPIWLVSNVLWVTYFGMLGDKPSIILWIVFSIFNVYGWVMWTKDRNKNKK